MKPPIKDWNIIKRHILIDISYGSGGTFNKLHGNQHVFDAKSATRAMEVLDELEKYLYGKQENDER